MLHIAINNARNASAAEIASPADGVLHRSRASIKSSGKTAKRSNVEFNFSRNSAAPLKIVPDLIESNFVATHFPNGEAALASAELGEDSSGNLIAREPAASRGNCTAQYNSPSLLHSYFTGEQHQPRPIIDRPMQWGNGMD